MSLGSVLLTVCKAVRSSDQDSRSGEGCDNVGETAEVEVAESVGEGSGKVEGKGDGI